MGILSLKKIGFYLAIFALFSTQAIYAECENSRRCEEAQRDERRDAIVAIHQIIDDLNILILFQTLPAATTNRPAILDAYNVDLQTAARNLEFALTELCGRSAGVADAFIAYSVAAENAANGTGSLGDLFTAALNLSVQLIELNPNKIDPVRINELVQQLTVAIAGVIQLDAAANFPGAIVQYHLAEETAQRLIRNILNHL